ncbi:hypothetical protein CDEST_01849 [Colletotrichum destructivum]|uniref:Uncharacterized protein n=1 Tax=Colletotrichum destructivum TaxID=34406 RepID=A0AAX4I0X8_9PEZI|nr:hypothetical protein CDEST_01849 [Colletotrichum destructivum]
MHALHFSSGPSSSWPRILCIAIPDEDRYGSDNDDKDEDEDDDNNNINSHAIQLNIPLVLPPPVDRQLLSLCFHSSWRTRSQLRFHFRNVNEVLLDHDEGSDTNQDPESEPDPEHRDTRLTIVTYDPIVALSPSITTTSNIISRRLLLASSAAVLFPNITLPAVENEFFELYLSNPADIDPSLCLKVVNLLDDANEHLARLLVRLNAPYMGNTVYTLRYDLILMRWSIDQQRQRQERQQQQQQPFDADKDVAGAWNRTAERIFDAVTSQVPSW